MMFGCSLQHFFFQVDLSLKILSKEFGLNFQILNSVEIHRHNSTQSYLYHLQFSQFSPEKQGEHSQVNSVQDPSTSTQAAPFRQVCVSQAFASVMECHMSAI